MSNDRQQADKLEIYLEQPEQYDGSLDPATEQIVDSLQQAAQHTQPRPGFLNELAQQLEKERPMQPHSPTTVQRGLRLLLGGVGLVAALALIFYAATLFSEPDIEPSVSEMESPIPILIRRPESGPFAGQEIRVMQPLPPSPGQVPQYRARLERVPTTIEEAKELAASLGIVEPEVYQYPTSGPHWIIMGRDGASLTLDPTQSDFAGFYYSHSMTNLIEGEPPPFAEAARIAEEILGSAGLLPDAYEIEDLPEQGEPGQRIVRFVPLVDGRPVIGPAVSIDATISSDSQLTSLRVTPFTLETAGETLSIKSAEDALQELLDGPGNYHYSFNYVPGAEPTQIYRPRVERFSDGEEVTLTGTVNVLNSIEGERLRAFMTSYEATTTVELVGPRIQELLDLRNDRGFEATGIIRKPAGSEQMQLELTEWNQPESVTVLSSCRIGVLTRDGASGTLQTDDGASIELDNLPDDLQGGQRVEVCGLLDAGDGQVHWGFITVPPVSGSPAMSGGGGAGSSVGAVEEAVEVTRIVTDEAGNVVQPAPTATRDSSGSGVSSAAPMPVQSAGPLLELGETVTLTGTIAGAAVWSGEQRQLHLGLHVEEGDPLQPTTQYYPLTGSAETLEALSENYRLHVQITGTVVEMDSQASNQQGILVTEFSRPWPGEQIETFLGYIEWVELGGQEVALFTDEESGQEYILPNAWGFLPNPEQKVWMEGVVHPTHQIEGRPLFQPFGQRSGTDIDNATSASDFVPETTLPETHNNARQNAPGLQGTLIIDRVVLGYSTSLHASAEGSPTETLLTPVWIFSGRTADGTQKFQIEVDAASGD